MASNTIDVKSAEAILAFSYLGYKTVESSVSTRTQLDVTLEEDAARLDDGYHRLRHAPRHRLPELWQRSIPRNWVKAPVASITNVLAGSVPGVATVQTSGTAG